MEDAVVAGKRAEARSASHDMIRPMVYTGKLE